MSQSDKGVYAYDFGDTGKLTPLVKMHTLGSGFIPPAIHSGGLRYHGMAPLVSHLKELNLIEARAADQLDCFKAGLLFAQNEGIIPAPESTHAIKVAIDEALLCKEEEFSRTIAFNLSGHGLLDLGSYATYFTGTLENTDFHEDEMKKAILDLPVI